MATKDRVMTAPLAIIKVNGVVVGKMKNLRITESIRRGRVTGLGQLYADELPALEWTGTLSCSFYNIDLRKSMIPGAIQRSGVSLEEWTSTVLLQEDGVQVDIMRRVKKTKEAEGNPPFSAPGSGVINKGLNIGDQLEVFASVVGCFLNREGFDISEGQISGRDADFDYMTPILFPA